MNKFNHILHLIALGCWIVFLALESIDYRVPSKLSVISMTVVITLLFLEIVITNYPSPDVKYFSNTAEAIDYLKGIHHD